MKDRKWKLFLVILVVAAVAVIFAAVRLIAPNSMPANAMYIGKINKMAKYINEKYGYSMSAADVAFFIEEDYSSRESFIVTVTYDIPFVAVFEKDGVAITVTDRKGFLSDDGQLEELNTLLCDYYMDQTGLTGLEYISVRDSGNGNLGDILISDLLQYHFNEKLTADNIDAFMDVLWETCDSVELVFYFREAQDRQRQLEEIAEKLKN